MSTDLQVYVHPENIPTVANWQKRILDAGFDLHIDIDSPFEDQSGFQPATLNGEPAGFEIYVSPSEYDLVAELEIAVKGLTVTVTFCTGSSMHELRSSYIAACVLTKITNGVFHDTERGKIISADGALAYCHAALKGLRESNAVTTAAKSQRPWWKVW